MKKRAPMKRPRCSIFRVCALVGVRLRPTRQRYSGPLRPRDCFCRATLRRIGRRHGEGHLALVLRLIVETTGGGELYGETITGISILLTRHPQLLDRGSRLFDDFDELELGRMRRHARALAVNDRVGEALSVLLALKLLDLDACCARAAIAKPRKAA